MPSESDSSDQTRQGEYGEGVEKGHDRKKKLGNQSAQASKKDDDEPNGEEATKESPFSDHLTGSHLVNMLRFKTLIKRDCHLKTFCEAKGCRDDRSAIGEEEQKMVS